MLVFQLFKIVFGSLRLSFNAVNTIFMCKIGINTNMLVQQCAFMQVFRKQPGYVLIGACVLIRMNMVDL